jgi:hypothetical protein
MTALGAISYYLNFACKTQVLTQEEMLGKRILIKEGFKGSFVRLTAPCGRG